jgi:hypothetical protein
LWSHARVRPLTALRWLNAFNLQNKIKMQQKNITYSGMPDKMYREIIKQATGSGHCKVYPKRLSNQVNEACDNFFKSRNIKYGSSWFHKQADRKQEQAKDERTKNN